MKTFQVLGLGLSLVFGSAALASGLTELSELQSGKSAQIESKENKLLVTFWATWCPSCEEHLAKELPALDARPDVTVVTVNTDKEAKRAQHFVQKHDVKLPVFLDSSGSLRKELKVFSVPHWALYSRKSSRDAWTLVTSQPAFEMSAIEAALKR
jgi:thiol-disulfide isomerase/thioredoxin